MEEAIKNLEIIFDELKKISDEYFNLLHQEAQNRNKINIRLKKLFETDYDFSEYKRLEDEKISINKGIELVNKQFNDKVSKIKDIVPKEATVCLKGIGTIRHTDNIYFSPQTQDASYESFKTLEKEFMSAL